MEIDEFIQIHEYINDLIDDKDEEIIHLMNDVINDLYLIKEKLNIDNKTNDDTISDK